MNLTRQRVPRAANTKSEAEINKEVVKLVRELVGPVAAFRLVNSVEALPKTRSGKIARKSIADLARNKKVAVRVVCRQTLWPGLY